MAKAKARRSLVKDSPFIRLQNEVGQHPEIRQNLIKKIEVGIQAKVVAYFASFNRTDSELTDDDAEMLESLLAAEHSGGKLVLIINSPGGHALAAERIVNVCRAYSNDQFEVLVPHMAKSAATMVCFGASRVYMSKTSELGPVDPQVPYKGDGGEIHWISAQEYVTSYEKLMKASSSGVSKRIEPYILQLSKYDARFIERLISVQKLSEDISVRLLRSSMMRRKSEAQIIKAIQVFLAQPKKRAHGRMINYAEAKNCGLNIQLIELGSDLWNLVWELFVRSDWVANRHAKILESSASATHYVKMVTE
jgi:ATP-dependent protease ClpP protease subunit